MFDRTYLLNLERRPDRLVRFRRDIRRAGWPFGVPIRRKAIDGEKVPAPSGYSQQPGAWGCLQSHLAMWVEAMNDGLGAIMIFEDDCVFSADFAERLPAVLADVPDDWDMLYLGGLARRVSRHEPQRISERLWRLYGITGTWAYALSARVLPDLYRWFMDRPMSQTGHLDRMLCQYHVYREPKVYAPHPWLCGLGGGQSDICTRNYPHDHWWHWDPAGGRPPQYVAHTLLSRVRARGAEPVSSRFGSWAAADATKDHDHAQTS